MKSLIRVAALSIVIALLGCGVTTTIFTAKLGEVDEAQRAATATATGSVIDDFIGPDENIVVRWTDTTGDSREQEFGIYDVDRYIKGESFEVRYDPADPASRAFPGDPEETLARDDLEAGLFLPWVIPGSVAVLWIVVLTTAARARRRPSTHRAVEICGTRRHRTSLGSVVAVVRFVEDGETLRQRVAWTPEIDVLPRTVDAEVTGGRARAFRLPSGTWLLPIGSTKNPGSRPEVWSMAAVRTTAADAFLESIDSPTTRLPQAVAIAAIATLAAAAIGLGVSGPLLAVTMASLAPTVTVSAWLAAMSAP